MANTIFNFERRLHQFLHPNDATNYHVYLSEAENYMATAPLYLIVKWSREFKHKGYSSVIPTSSDYNILLQDGFVMLFQNGDSAITKS